MGQPLTTVFVYGTLMPGERNAHVAAQGGPFVARPATLPGYRLLHLHPEAYPALRPGEIHEQVKGYALTYEAGAWATALPLLDALEGFDEHPPLYTREEVRLRLDSGEIQPAWVYIYARAERLQAPGVTHLPEGRWKVLSERTRPHPDHR
ncbi:gamma-glutamylcyclotransferase [Deinococcus malanensis]|uniref:Putative gamma-glutamylcyclotransferase n=1 Tax=Deinococcus malanensis TaxID=1706855 RepID=A0ABQ2EZ54_9DEIO|nr:gamma-glutamylcyclotransferase family protein [Deinococcus malanensis]GGK32105.1 gamma-glutamylcyclotransferase [Deinococcus malanensis]